MQTQDVVNWHARPTLLCALFHSRNYLHTAHLLTTKEKKKTKKTKQSVLHSGCCSAPDARSTPRVVPTNKCQSCLLADSWRLMTQQSLFDSQLSYSSDSQELQQNQCDDGCCRRLVFLLLSDTVWFKLRGARCARVSPFCSQVFVGLSFPYEGPAPLEALANGCAFLNPRLDPPQSRLNSDFFKDKPTIREVIATNLQAQEGSRNPLDSFH